MKKIKLLINNISNREKIILALANAGYKIYIVEEGGKFSWYQDFYVCFEVDDKNILDK